MQKANGGAAVAPWEQPLEPLPQKAALAVDARSSRTLSQRSDGRGRQRSPLSALAPTMSPKSPRGAYSPLPGGNIFARSGTQGWCCTWPVIMPESSTYIRYWDIVVFCGIALTAIWTPYEIVYVKENPTKEITGALDFRSVFDVFMTLVFLKDLILQFFLAHPVELDGTTIWVSSPGKIVRHYCCGWFWFDFIACFPFFTAGIFLRRYCLHSVSFEDLQILRLVRLIRVRRLGHLLWHWQFSLGMSYGALSLAKFGCFAALSCHWMSCIWGFLALTPPGGMHERTWLTNLNERKGLDADADRDNPAEVYMLSLYWSVMTLTSLGYGDIVAQNSLEYKMSIVFFILCGFGWAYIIGAICSIIGNMDPLTLQYQQNMDLLNIMMEDYNLQADMRKRLRKYFHATRYLQRQMNQKSVVEALSPGLQGELAVLLTQRWMHQIWYLSNVEADAVTEISKRLFPMVFCTGEVLHLRGMSSSNNHSALFVIVKGVAGREGNIFIRNSVIGDDVILYNSILRRTSKASAITFVEVMYLKSEYLEEIREAFPTVETRIRRAEARWAVRRGFVLAAWRLVESGGPCGPRTSAYFKRHIPSFTNAQTLKHWCKEPWEAIRFLESGREPSVVVRPSHRTLRSTSKVSTHSTVGPMVRIPSHATTVHNAGCGGVHLREEMMAFPEEEEEDAAGTSNATLRLLVQLVSQLDARLARIERRMPSGSAQSANVDARFRWKSDLIRPS